MTTGFEDLALLATMTLSVVMVPLWPGIINGSVFFSIGFAEVNSVVFAIK